jgi:MFS family permease
MGIGNIRYKGYLIVGAILTYCCLLVALATSPWFLLSILIVGALGLTDSLQATPRNAVIQLVTPDALRGRVSAFQNMLTAGMPALGLATVGSMAAILGAPLALIVGAATCAAINLSILAARSDLRARDLGSEPAPEIDERLAPTTGINVSSL